MELPADEHPFQEYEDIAGDGVIMYMKAFDEIPAEQFIEDAQGQQVKEGPVQSADATVTYQPDQKRQ